MNSVHSNQQATHQASGKEEAGSSLRERDEPSEKTGDSVLCHGQAQTVLHTAAHKPHVC